MTVQAIETITRYRSSHDDTFETTCRHHAEAFDFVYPLKDVITERVRQSERFTTEARLLGEVERQMAEHIWFETERRRSTPDDYFGIKEVFASAGLPTEVDQENTGGAQPGHVGMTA